MSMFKRALAGLGEAAVEISEENIRAQNQSARDKALFVQQQRLQQMRNTHDANQRGLDRTQRNEQWQTEQENLSEYRDGTLAIQRGDLDRKRKNDKFDRFDKTLNTYVGAVQKLDEAWAEQASFLDPEDPQTKAKYDAYVERRQQLSDRIDNLAAANPNVAEHYGFKPPAELDTQDVEMSEEELKAEEERALAIAEDLGVPGVGDNPAPGPKTEAPDPVEAEREATGVKHNPSGYEKVGGLFSRAASAVGDNIDRNQYEAQMNELKNAWAPRVLAEFEETGGISETAAKHMARYQPEQLSAAGLPTQLVDYISTFRPGYKPGAAAPAPAATAPTATAATGVPR